MLTFNSYQAGFLGSIGPLQPPDVIVIDGIPLANWTEDVEFIAESVNDEGITSSEWDRKSSWSRGGSPGCYATLESAWPDLQHGGLDRHHSANSDHSSIHCTTKRPASGQRKPPSTSVPSVWGSPAPSPLPCQAYTNGTRRYSVAVANSPGPSLKSVAIAYVGEIPESKTVVSTEAPVVARPSPPAYPHHAP
ncbi:unnamed protein product [Phytophthora fragariaefolia]|uniref:Unnamed protein product n=1 Tax=Phytophthora fragariaefolia TaxID=1490495 RepID=A0A9W6XJL2_9STRA|nr:unnamed protein product [Phytophthora fragariaefolia]